MGEVAEEAEDVKVDAHLGQSFDGQQGGSTWVVGC